jgi:uncharacterized protein
MVLLPGKIGWRDMKRYLESQIIQDLKEKMVFIGGPRQVGKTKISQQVAQAHFNRYEYFNWDVYQDQKRIIDYSFSPDSELLIFDEVHKYKNWKNHIKGIFDSRHEKHHIMVTGSARLDLYRKGGDSMMGRYHYHRLHPISLAEAAELSDSFEIDLFERNYRLKFSAPQNNILSDLMSFGGFPEPFLRKNKRSLKRWQNERKSRLVREDIRDIELIRELSIFQLLVSLLPERVGSVFSVNSLREDLRVSHQTVARWMDILESFYYCYRIYPFTATTIKSLRKEPKLFLWDYSEITDESTKFENLIASHLLKFVHYLTNCFGTDAKLMYLRDIQKREVDFVVVIDGKPILAIEVKMKTQKISTPMKYFIRKLKIPFGFQVVFETGIDFQSKTDNIRVISADKFLTALV